VNTRSLGPNCINWGLRTEPRSFYPKVEHNFVRFLKLKNFKQAPIGIENKMETF